MRRFDPAFVELKAYLDSGELGAARVVHCVHRNAQSHPTATSEGIVVNSMIHELDHLPWLLGEPLTAITVITPTLPEGVIRDPQIAVLESASGILATVEVFVNARYGYDVQCEVVGERGTARLTPPYGLSLRRDGGDGRRVSDDFVQRFADAYRIELSAWIASIRTRPADRVRAPGTVTSPSLSPPPASSRCSSGGRVEIADPEMPALYR